LTAIRLQTAFATQAVKEKTPSLSRQGFFFVAEGALENAFYNVS
jgi:hypothetical protein